MPLFIVPPAGNTTVIVTGSYSLNIGVTATASNGLQDLLNLKLNDSRFLTSSAGLSFSGTLLSDAEHGNLTSGVDHAPVTYTSAGFMTAADKTKSDTYMPFLSPWGSELFPQGLSNVVTASSTTLSANVYCYSYYVPAGVTVITNNYTIFAQSRILIDSGATVMFFASGGQAAGTGLTNAGFVVGGPFTGLTAQGGIGQSGSGQTAAQPWAGGNSSNVPAVLGGMNGNAGGPGSSSVGASPGARATIIANRGDRFIYTVPIFPFLGKTSFGGTSGMQVCQMGSGGGGGGYDAGATVTAGCGGAGGGVVQLIAPEIVISGTVSAKGGNGGDGVGNVGAGGGGGGGLITLIARSMLTSSATFEVAGGTRGDHVVISRRGVSGASGALLPYYIF